MKIIGLKAENIKRLVAVDIEPKSNVVKITGRNGQGKTSVLDSIWWALGGAKDIQKSPIRNGADAGFVRLDLGEMIVTRSFKHDKDGEVTTSLSVVNKDGVKFPSPQAMIDKLLGEFCFDPLAFARAETKEQFNRLRKLIPDVDFDKIDQDNKRDFEQRTEVNRQAKQLRAAADQITTTVKHTDTPIDQSALMTELSRANAHNESITLRANNRNAMAREMANKLAQADALMAEAKQIEAKLLAAGELPQPIDTQAIQAKVIESTSINRGIELAREKQRTIEQAEKLEKLSAEITKRMDDRNADKKAKISAAKMPVSGLSLDNGEVYLNGVPFNQASDAEQLRASVAIAMSFNPKIRIIRVRDGSLLDETSQKIIEEMADKNDYQIWEEIVDSSGQIGFVIENGTNKTETLSEPEIDLE